MVRGGDRALADFLAEAEEILEGADKDLDAVETALRSDKKPRPDSVNRLFRHLHSLKGLAGMVGISTIADLSHDLEDLLDKVRLGKIPLDLECAQLLVQAVALLRHMMKEVGEGGATQSDIQPMAQRIFALSQGKKSAAAGDWRAAVNLEPEILQSLSEYEEHRLRDNVENGMPLFSLVVSYSFDDFDVRLRALAERVAAEGEVISTLPVVGGGPPDKLTFRLLVAHEGGEPALQALAAFSEGTYSWLTRAPGAPSVAATPAAAAAPAASVPAPARKKDAASILEPESLEPAGDATAATGNVRVDIAKLDAVMGLVGEIALIKSRLGAITRQLTENEATKLAAQQVGRAARDLEKKLNELQKSVVDIRMVPVGQIFSRLARFARRLAPELAKTIDVQLYGEETELDKAMVEAVSSPLMHVIRNALDHGLEPSEARVAAGKPASGTLKLEAFQRGNSVVLKVSDDGRGIDTAKVKARALERGLIQPGQETTPEGLMEVLFIPGFSTAEAVSELSGRGVGLDVVRKAITELKGQITVDSRPGEGTTFEITLPITLAIIQSLLVTVSGRDFVIPLSAISETLRMMIHEINTVDRREVINLRGRSLPLIWLEDFYKLPNGLPRNPERRIFVVVVKIAEKMMGLVIDDLTGQQEVVIKSLGRRLGSLPGIAGACELGQGEPVLVVDVASLFVAGKDRFDGRTVVDELKAG